MDIKRIFLIIFGEDKKSLLTEVQYFLSPAYGGVKETWPRPCVATLKTWPMLKLLMLTNRSTITEWND